MNASAKKNDPIFNEDKSEDSNPSTEKAQAPTREERAVTLHQSLIGSNPQRDLEIQIGTDYGDKDMIKVKSKAEKVRDSDKMSAADGAAIGFLVAGGLALVAWMAKEIIDDRNEKFA